ncbi:MAG: hypothetical protein ACTSXD_00865, partial [Candidatus Heimdallarchaeaceae archaeon]
MKELTAIQKEIIVIISDHDKLYPINTKEIVNQTDFSNAWINKQLKILLKSNLIDSIDVKGINGPLVFHKLQEEVWPDFIINTCGQCHNWTSIKTCTFHDELCDMGCKIEPNRLKYKLSSSTVACPWYIERNKRWKSMSLQKFLKSIRGYSDCPNNKGLPVYFCFYCNEQLTSIGAGFMPLIGSSVFRCFNCESMYKLVFDEKKDEYRMLFTEEKGDICRNNIFSVTGAFSTIEPYSSTRYGITISESNDCLIDFQTET